MDIICYVQCKASLCFLIEIIHLIIVFLEFIHCITVFLSLCIVLSFFLSLSIVISFFLSLCIVLSFSFSLSIVLPLLYYHYCITVIVLPFFIQWTIVFTVFLDWVRSPASRLLRLDQAIWTSGSAENFPGDRKYGVRFENRALQKAMRALFDIDCPHCLWLGHGGQLPAAAGPRQEVPHVEDLVPEHWVLTSLLVSFLIPEEDVVFSGFQTLLYPPPAEGNPVWRLRVMRVHFWKTPQNSSLLVTPILESNQRASKASGTPSQVLP